MLAVPLPAAADWLQEGFDAAHTAATPDAGPAWGDVALVLEGENNLAVGGNEVPLIIGDSVYVVRGRGNSLAMPCQTAGPTEYEFLAINLTSLESRIIERYPVGPFCSWPAFASDGVRIFLAYGGIVRAYDIATGAWPWEVDLDRLLPSDLDPLLPADAKQGVGSALCDSIQVELGRLYLACFSGTGAHGVPFWASLSTENGRLVAGPTRLTTDGSPRVNPEGTPLPLPIFTAIPAGESIRGLAVLDGVSAIIKQESLEQISPSPGVATNAVHSFILWVVSGEGVVLSSEFLTITTPTSPWGEAWISAPAWAQDQVAYRLSSLLLFDPATGETVSAGDVRDGISAERQPDSSCASGV